MVELAKTTDVPAQYIHPSTIQCNASTEIDNLKSSVSSGKQQVANAITGKGVSASQNDSFATLANKISQIASLTPSQQTILSSSSIGLDSISNNTRVRQISGPTKIYGPSRSSVFDTGDSGDTDLIHGELLRIGFGDIQDYVRLYVSYSISYNTSTGWIFTYNAANSSFRNYSSSLISQSVTHIDNKYQFSFTVNLENYKSDYDQVYWDNNRTDQSTKTVVAELSGYAYVSGVILNTVLDFQ